MRIGTAIERLIKNYQYAVKDSWVKDKVAWALYQTWCEADEKREKEEE